MYSAVTVTVLVPPYVLKVINVGDTATQIGTGCGFGGLAGSTVMVNCLLIKLLPEATAIVKTYVPLNRGTPVNPWS